MLLVCCDMMIDWCCVVLGRLDAWVGFLGGEGLGGFWDFLGGRLRGGDVGGWVDVVVTAAALFLRRWRLCMLLVRFNKFGVGLGMCFRNGFCFWFCGLGGSGFFERSMAGVRRN